MPSDLFSFVGVTFNNRYTFSVFCMAFVRYFDYVLRTLLRDSISNLPRVGHELRVMPRAYRPFVTLNLVRSSLHSGSICSGEGMYESYRDPDNSTATKKTVRYPMEWPTKVLNSYPDNGPYMGHKFDERTSCSCKMANNKSQITFSICVNIYCSRSTQWYMSTFTKLAMPRPHGSSKIVAQKKF